jgi:hypothetical protein
VYGPFKDQKSSVSVSDLQEQSQLQNIAAILSLQNQDTDQDGLSDYDEMYSYRTSPYLKDTDSDGIYDKAELEQGTDPLCPKDKDCSGSGITLPKPNLENEILPIPSQVSEFGAPPFVNTPNNTLPNTIPPDPSANMSADQLRSLLLQSGFAKEQLDAFSDEELLKTWKGVGGG